MGQLGNQVETETQTPQWAADVLSPLKYAWEVVTSVGKYSMNPVARCRMNIPDA